MTTKYILRIRTGQKTGPEYAEFSFASEIEAQQAVKLVKVTEEPVSLGAIEMCAKFGLL